MQRVLNVTLGFGCPEGIGRIPHELHFLGDAERECAACWFMQNKNVGDSRSG